MEKEFVTYELALRMKQLGFNKPCFARFSNDGDLLIAHTEKYIISNGVDRSEFFTLAPTWQQAFRWFREMYNINAWVQPFMREKNGTPFLPDESYGYWIFKDGVYVTDEVDFLNTEEAELACLEKLIDIVEQSKSE